MPHITANRVLETSTTTGTGDITTTAAVTGFIRISATTQIDGTAIASGCTFKYSLWGVDASGVPTGEWENGLGTYGAANVFARTRIEGSSNSGSVVTLSAGTKYVAMSLLVADIPTPGQIRAYANGQFSL